MKAKKDEKKLETARKLCISDGEINMLFAKEADRRMIYDMSMAESEIVLSMFDNKEDFRWEDIRDEEPEYFDEEASLNKYLLIEYNTEIIGFFCSIHHQAQVENVEFHIWFVSKKYTGRGLGTRVVTMMKEYIRNTYKLNTFVMRPWIRNPQAIRTYEKCGFKIVEEFDLNQYFTPREVEKYGNGAYTVEETVNMISSN